MSNLKNLLGTSWQPEPPAEPSAIEALPSESGLDLPEDYLQFLRFSNGGEGELGVKPGWFQLWPTEEVIGLNKGYEVQKWVAGFFGFGSNGGGELLAFDTRKPQPWKVYMIPFECLREEEAVLVADSFASFVKAIGQVSPD